MNTCPLLSLTSAALLASLPTAHAAIITYYSFDTDFSDAVGGNDLSASSGSPGITAGDAKFGGGALNLDQSGTQQHLAFATPISFDGTSPWSAAWWGQRSASAPGASGMIAGTITSSSNFIWTPNNPSVVQGLRVRDSSNNSTDFGGIIDDNAYHHWAVAYDGAGNVEVWRDNVSLGSKTFSGVIDLTHVGAGTGNQANSFYGQIDELYFYDEAITGTTVSQLFTGVPEPSSLALLGLGGLVALRRRR